MTTKFDDAVRLILEAKEAYVKAMREHGFSGVRGLCNALLEESGAAAVQWRQYTPYFNDGEPCEFHYCEAELGVRIPAVPAGYSPYGESDWGDDPVEDDEITDSYIAWGAAYDGEIKYARCQVGTSKNQRTRYPYGYRGKPETYYEDVPNYEYLSVKVGEESIREFNKKMYELEDVLLAVFGDHVKVTYDGTDFKVEDYDHD